MNIISYNEIHLVGVKTNEVNKYLRKIRTFFEKEQISQDYSIIVHDDEVACCGVRNLREIAIELQGPEKQPVEGLDAKIFSKISEICQSKSIEKPRCKSHEFTRESQVPA